MAKPRERCFSSKLSATKALKGSMVTLMLESKIHNTPAAIQTEPALGITNNKHELKIAPTKKKGLLLPSFGCQVRSLK